MGRGHMPPRFNPRRAAITGCQDQTQRRLAHLPALIGSQMLVFYLAFTRVSEIVLERLMQRLSHGQATTGGEAQRKAAA